MFRYLNKSGLLIIFFFVHGRLLAEGEKGSTSLDWVNVKKIFQFLFGLALLGIISVIHSLKHRFRLFRFHITYSSKKMWNHLLM